jgi:hypothetical protein
MSTITVPKAVMQQALEALEFMADQWGFTHKANRPERWQAITALRAALEQPPLTFDRLANALVMSRLIDKDAIENPEEYDDGVTLDQVRAAYRRLV